MLLDITDQEIKELYEFIQTVAGGEDIDVDITEKEIKILARRALKDFMYEINLWQLRNKFSNIVGQTASTDFTKQFIFDNTMIAQRISDWFASMARIGGKIPWKKDYFQLFGDKQIYDLSTESSVPYTPGTRRINKIMWYARPELVNNFGADNLNDPGYLTFGLSGVMLGQAPLTFLGNLFDTMLLGQALEARNKVLRSEFFYNISGDIVELTPMNHNLLTPDLTPTLGPSTNSVWPTGTYVFYYYFDESMATGLDENGKSLLDNSKELIANPFQVKLDNVPYSDLNDFAKSWVDNYTWSLALYMQAAKWRKVRTIASPESSYQIEFDYQSMMEESKTKQEILKQSLQEQLLAALDTVKMMEDKASIVDNASKINQKSPRQWFWG